MAILETQELTRRFGALTAVDNLTVAVEAGEVFARMRVIPSGNTPYIDFIAPAS